MDAQDTSANGKEPQIHGTGPHLMGGFEPEEGLGHHSANRPKRNPVPSLLRTLLSDHLDAGYLEAAQAARTGPSRARGWPNGAGRQSRPSPSRWSLPRQSLRPRVSPPA